MKGDKTASKTVVQLLILGCVALLMFFPIFNDVTHLLPEKPPHGVGMPKPAVWPSEKIFLNRKWQKRIEERAKKHSGLWAPLVMFGNELYYLLFNQISAFHNPSVLVGGEGHLFQPAHLAAFNNAKKTREKKIRKRMEAVLELQERLRNRGSSLVLVISPNLISLYPELADPAYINPDRKDISDDYAQVTKLIGQLGINNADSFQMLKQEKNRYPFRFFARSASHWNDVASCLALKQVNDVLKSSGGKTFPEFSCNNWKVEPAPRSKDRDLVEITNILRPENFFEPVPYVTPGFTLDQQARPSVLLVGTSYLFALEGHINDWKLASRSTLYFYYRQVRQGGKRHFNLLRKDKIDWEEILSRDIVIINVNISNPSVVGYGFVEDALLYLNGGIQKQSGNGKQKKSKQKK